MGVGCGCVYWTFLLFCVFGGGGVHCGIEQLLPIRGVACRGLAVKGWNHGVSGEVEVAPVIGQYLGLGCFGIVEWPGQHCHCPRNLRDLCFHSLSSLRFSPLVLPGHWIGGMRLRIVYASHIMFEGIPGICWRWKVAHCRYWVRLECHMFGFGDCTIFEVNMGWRVGHCWEFPTFVEHCGGKLVQ